MKKPLHETLLKQICNYCGSDYSKAFDVREHLKLPSIDAPTLEALDYLENQGFIYHSYDENHRYVVYIKYAGLQYCKNELTNGILHWIKKNILELIAIAIAIIALLKQ